MSGKTCYRVRVKDEKRRVVIDWTKPFMGQLTVSIQGGKTVIVKRGWFSGRETYIFARNQSIETRCWFNEWLRRYRTGQ